MNNEIRLLAQLEASEQARATACMEEVNAVLAKRNCKLRVEQVFVDGEQSSIRIACFALKAEPGLTGSGAMHSAPQMENAPA